MNKQYLTYLWKHFKKAMIIATIIISIITLSTPIFTYIDPSVDKLSYSYLLTNYAKTLTSITTILLVVFILISHSVFFKKQTVDMHFSIPVTKKEISITSSIFVYGYAMILFVSLYILGGMIFLVKGVSFNVLVYFLYLLMGIVSLTFISSLMNLACSLSNNVLDAILTYGIGTSSFAVVLFFIFLLVLPALSNSLITKEVLSYFLAFSGGYIQNNILSFVDTNISLYGNISVEGSLIVSLVVSLLKIPAYSYFANRFNDKYQAEDASTPSKNKFGITNLVFPLYFIYSFMIGLFAYIVIENGGYTVLTYIAILCIFILVGIYVTEGIINRSFRLNKKEFLRILVPFFSGIIIGIVYTSIFGDIIFSMIA